MAKYLAPIDIANRALDHCGVPPIVAFTDDSKAAERTSANYDKLRGAELRRNVWRFSIRKVALRAVDTDTMFLVPEPWTASESYPQDSIVLLAGVIYFAAQYVPAGITPGTPNEVYWTVYFGPQTVTPWNPPPPSPPPPGLGPPVYTYYAGELVYNVVAGVVSVYQCLVTGTTDDPTAAPAAWSPTISYNTGDTVTSGGVWQSVVDINMGNSPAAGAYWQSVPVANQASTQVGQNWLQIDAAVRYQRFQYPIGAGPRQQATTRNIFRLPSGFLREAPQDPKRGIASYLGMPSGLPQNDWTFEGDYIVTMDSSVIVLRFVADIQDVTLMDPMFCEGLGARLGLEICEPLTQSGTKLQTISQIYKTFMGDARVVNGIEAGPIEMPLDDYLVCRI